jgi:Mn-containing catalase
VDGTFPEGRWTSGPSMDGKGEFTVFRNEPLGDEPVMGPARPDSGAQNQQIG